MLEIEPIALLRDNYAYLLRDSATGQVAVVDPSTSDGVVERLETLQWPLHYILNTHHHHDHVGGNRELKDRYQAVVVGFEGDSHRIPGLEVAVGVGHIFRLGQSEATILGAAGHTLGHILYWFSADKALFSGDTLFSLGCGRLFEGSADQMWRTLKQLKELPPDTRLYCGHEYTADNATFALALAPGNDALKKKSDTVTGLRKAGKPTVPSLLQEEWQCNPFLRADDPELRRSLGLESASDAEVFAEIRRRKDVF